MPDSGDDTIPAGDILMCGCRGIIIYTATGVRSELGMVYIGIAQLIRSSCLMNGTNFIRVSPIVSAYTAPETRWVVDLI